MIRWKRLAKPLLAAVLFLVALRVVFGELRHFHYAEAAAFLRSLNPLQLVLAIVATAASYAALVFSDLLATRNAGHALTWRRTAFASFVSSAVSNTVGLAGIAGGSLRYRLYTAWGLSTAEVARVIAFVAATFWLGFLTLAGVVLTVDPVLPRLVGPLMLIVPLVYVVIARRAALVQIGIGVVDWACAALVFFALLPAGRVDAWTAVAAFLAAQIAGVISNVPAGMGVFEASILALLSPRIDAGSLAGALIAYRAVYYLLPLAAAGALMARASAFGRGVARTAALFAPAVFSVAVFVDGAVLLVSGATPAQTWRLTRLSAAVPLPLVELAHLIGAMSGVGLLLLARGIQRRLQGAFVLSASLLTVGVAASLLKGLDYEEAILLAATLAALIPCRAYFYRRSSLVDEPFSIGWVTAIGLATAASVWLGFFAYRRIEYDPAMWWHFSFTGDAPRFLRASLAAAAVALVFSVRKLLRAAPVELPATSQEDLTRAEAIARATPAPHGHLVLLRDKSLLFNEERNAFLMYAVQRRSWVAMGDPIGARPDAYALAWRFFEEADRHDGWPVFYQVRAANLPLYVELGLHLLKLGEEARVRTESFTLVGRKSLRHTVRRIESEGARLELVHDTKPILDDLRRVSDDWLIAKSTREKRFSLGAFDPDYLQRLPLAVVCYQGEIVAFANVWGDDAREELTVDLMRHSANAPAGVMDFLFTKLIEHARDEGYRWFNLGIAPLSGVEARAQGPLWGRLAAVGVEHGGRFYNFQGLRRYKSKFGPEWEPVFLASPGGMRLPLILGDIAALVSGGVRGILAK